MQKSHPVLPFNPQKDKLLLLDFTEKNKELTDEMLADTDLFSRYIDQKLFQHKALYGIGGYAEHRTIYSRSRLFDSAPGEEPRRFHLGIDIWGEALTPVSAPLTGKVHSFAFNDHRGDYGATIILSHSLEGNTFYTLYGHLSLQSLQPLHEGKEIGKGEVFASLGVAEENGHWPPHLHFQVILDMQDYKGDYPGVCKFSEKEKYLANSPDPDIILQLKKSWMLGVRC